MASLVLQLINKEYLTSSGKIDGKHACECVLPSMMGLTVSTTAFMCAASSDGSLGISSTKKIIDDCI